MNRADAIPADTVLEKNLLGALLGAGAAGLVQVTGILSAADFFTPAHGVLFGALVAMLNSGSPLELASVAADLRASGKMLAISPYGTDRGGAEFLSELVEAYSFDTASIMYYAKRVRALADLRRLHKLGEELQREATANDADPGSLAADAMQALHALGDSTTGAHVVHGADAVDSAIEHADAIRRGEANPALATGFPGIDHATGGLQPGALWILGAATSIGKSALAHTIAQHVATRGTGVLIVSAEMNRESVANRLLSAESGIGAMRLRTGNLHQEELQARCAARENIASWRLAILDRASTIPDVSIRAALLAAKWGQTPGLIVLDYLQLLTPCRGDNRAQEISGIVWDCKRMAMELGCAVLLLSQLNRVGARPGVQGDEGTPPSLFDLKESGDTENHADVVILLHRPMNGQLDTAGTIPVWCKVAKARDGLVTPWPSGKSIVPGSIVLRFRPGVVRFETSALRVALHGAADGWPTSFTSAT